VHLSEPTTQLEAYTGKQVLVVLRGGGIVRGLFMSFDNHLNIVLDRAEELAVGRPGEDPVPLDPSRPLGRVIIRGDNVVLVSPVEG